MYTGGYGYPQMNPYYGGAPMMANNGGYAGYGPAAGTTQPHSNPGYGGAAPYAGIDQHHGGKGYDTNAIAAGYANAMQQMRNGQQGSPPNYSQVPPAGYGGGYPQGSNPPGILNRINYS